jgi:hypothetical protein
MGDSARLASSDIDTHAVGEFRRRLVRYPYATDDPAQGVYRVPLDAALRLKLLQPNAARLTQAIVFDVDLGRWSIFAWCDNVPSAPCPNFTIANLESGNCHYVYVLAAPVATSNVSRIRPLQYLAAIQHAIGARLGADVSYSGLLAKNPFNRAWRTLTWRAEPYTLDELADCLGELPTLHDMRQRSQAETAGLGRNCYVFETVRRRAYALVREFWKPNGEKHFFGAVLELCRACNADFAEPLPDKEARIIARSISRWVWRRFTPSEYRATFSRIQAAKGKRKGAAKRDALMSEARSMHAAGQSQRQIAAALGIGQKTVCRWLKRG